MSLRTNLLTAVLAVAGLAFLNTRPAAGFELLDRMMNMGGASQKGDCGPAQKGCGGASQKAGGAWQKDGGKHGAAQHAKGGVLQKDAGAHQKVSAKAVQKSHSKGGKSKASAFSDNLKAFFADLHMGKSKKGKGGAKGGAVVKDGDSWGAPVPSPPTGGGRPGVLAPPPEAGV